MKKVSLNNFNITFDANLVYWLYISSSNNETTVHYPTYTDISDTELVSKITSLTDKYLKDIKIAINVHNNKVDKHMKEHPEEYEEEHKEEEVF